MLSSHKKHATYLLINNHHQKTKHDKKKSHSKTEFTATSQTEIQKTKHKCCTRKSFNMEYVDRELSGSFSGRCVPFSGRVTTGVAAYP